MYNKALGSILGTTKKKEKELAKEKFKYINTIKTSSKLDAGVSYL
jgi:hypothetical protein